MKTFSSLFALTIIAVSLSITGCKSDNPGLSAARANKERLFYSVVPRDVDEIAVANPSTGEILYTIKDTNLFNQLDSIVEFSTNKWKMGAHGCRGSADIYFKSKGEIKGRWNFAHQHFFVINKATPDTEKRLGEWFAGKGIKEFQKWQINDGGFQSKTPSEYSLDYLKGNQNKDGSWGENDSSLFLTSFSIAGFASRGETPQSQDYGKTMENGLKWLVKQNPASNTERVYVSHALSAAYFIMASTSSDEHSTINDKSMTELSIIVKTRIIELQKVIEPEKLEEPARTIFIITKPVDVTPGSTNANPKSALASFISRPAGPPALIFYLTILDTFTSSSSKDWQEYNRNVILPWIKARPEDGPPAIDGARSKTESAAFSLLSLTVYYRYWSLYLNIDHPVIKN